MFRFALRPAAWLGAVFMAIAAGPALAEVPGDTLARLKSMESDPALSATALRVGAKVAAVCANCHGDNGNSRQPDTPNLAGQNPRYLLEQMQKFVEGRRRNEFMEGMIKAMKPDERASAAWFYARQTVAPQPPVDAALRAKGKAYFDQVCFRCHGADGHGSENFARVAGQHPSYVAQALKRYRDGGELKRSDPLMSAATKGMSDTDIQAVAAYVASLP